MRVLWLIKGLGPGGAEQLLVAAARALESSELELECAYVLPHKNHLVPALEALGVTCTCLSSSGRDPRWPLRLRSLLSKGRFDVVHSHSPAPAVIGRLVALTLGRRRPRLMYTEHNSWPTYRWPTRLGNALTSPLESVIFAVTEESLESIKGPARRRALSLRHGIDTAAMAAHRSARAEVRAELGIGAEELVAGTVGNFRAQKDYPNLLGAARLLRERGVRLRIVAVGQGPLEAETRALCTSMGLDDMVHFTGFRSDAVRVMAACDIFTMASQWEGLPVALMEALALGLPVVATAVGGIAQELEPERDAVLVEPRNSAALADGLQRVAEDSVLRARLAARATERAQDFDSNESIRVIAAAYRGEPVLGLNPSGGTR